MREEVTPKQKAVARCTVCGHANPIDAWVCEACTADLAQEMVHGWTRSPMIWWVVGAFLLLVTGPMAMSYLVSPLRGLSLHLNACIHLPPKSASKLLDEVPAKDLATVARGLRCQAAPAAAKILKKAHIEHELILRNEFKICLKLQSRQRKAAQTALSKDDWTTVERAIGCATMVDAEKATTLLNEKKIAYQVTVDSSPTIGWPALFFALAAALLTLLTRRRIGREIGLASLVGIVVQIVFWIGAQGWNLAALVAQLHITKGAVDGSAISASNIVMPMVAFIAFVGVTYWLCAQASAALAQVVIERVTRKSSCLACGKHYANKPLPRACPSCGVGVSHARLNWSWILVAVAATAWLYFLAMTYGSGPLGVYHKCDLKKLSDRCQTALKAYRSDVLKDTEYVARRKRSPDTAWNYYRNIHSVQNRNQFILLHTTKYVGYWALLFFFAPFFLAWRLGGKGLQSAGISIPLSWGAAMMIGFLFFEMAAYTQTAFVLSMRLHMIALFGWGVAGFLGAMLGYKLGSRGGADLLADLDDSAA